MTELPPSRAGDVARLFPDVWNAYANLGKADGPVNVSLANNRL
jgi:hypothetical protein